MAKRPKTNEFVTAYLETALWSTTDEDGVPFDDAFGIDDFDESAVEVANRDHENFLDYVAKTGIKADVDNARGGHDFWLTRNRHGAGFWDGDWGKDGKALTDAAHTFGSLELYESDGKIYFG